MRPVPGPVHGSTWYRLRTVHLPFLLVLAVVTVAVVLVLLGRWRRGATLLGAALLLGAGLRAFLPERRAGLLAVRNRPSDVLTFAALGTAVLLLAASIDSLGS